MNVGSFMPEKFLNNKNIPEAYIAENMEYKLNLKIKVELENIYEPISKQDNPTIIQAIGNSLPENIFRFVCLR